MNNMVKQQIAFVHKISTTTLRTISKTANALLHCALCVYFCGVLFEQFIHRKTVEVRNKYIINTKNTMTIRGEKNNMTYA